MAELENVDTTVNGMRTTVKMTKDQAAAHKKREKAARQQQDGDGDASTKKRSAKNKSDSE